MLSKMEALEVSLYSDTINESLRSVVIISNLLRLPRAEEPLVKENVAMPLLKL